jgi:hypothetical protein
MDLITPEIIIPPAKQGRASKVQFSLDSQT